MEELLNKLIEKGWKPFGWEGVREAKKGSYINLYYGFNTHPELYHIRRLVSKESGLWQFVCGKGLVDMYEGFYWQNIFPLDSQEYDYTDYQYWILESSLIDEDKLEKFLLDNIKVS